LTALVDGDIVAAKEGSRRCRVVDRLCGSYRRAGLHGRRLWSCTDDPGRLRQPERRIAMSLGRLNVFVSELDHGCKVDSRTWFVTIYDCDGRVFEWCGRRYVAIPARCGHLEIELPPGCYTLLAAWSFAVGPGGIIYENQCNCTLATTYVYAVAPRIGVAYQIDKKTVFRGGIGGLGAWRHPNGAPN